MSSKINQKEYLKKYLSSDKSEKKKKKKKERKPIVGHTMKIIDDDIDLSKIQNINDDEIDLMMATGEDAPTIVGVIDLSGQDFKNNSKWRVVSNDDGFNSSLTVQQLDEDGIVQETRKNHIKKKCNGDEDLNVHRTKKRSEQIPDSSHKRVRTATPDLSPRRARGRNQSPDLSPRRKRDDSADTPPRRRRKDTPDMSPKRRNNDRSLSPYHRKNSPHRRTRRYSSDLSPKRGSTDRHLSPYQKSNSHIRAKRQSPERKNRSPDNRPKRKSRFTDLSPPRKQRSPDLPYQRSSKSLSPMREKQIKTRESSTPDNSPPRKKSEKMSKTLDGKAAGLQNAASLRIENDKFKKRENELFDKMTDEHSGRNADVVMRDKSTGKKRNFEMEAEQQKKKDEKELERKALYDKWGKGLKQVEEYRNRIVDDIHEMNKPLARYSDDNDLDDLLKKKERLGDPMLAYMRQKDHEKRKESGIPILPIYEGGFPDNRFNIRPGYRWDGVDRSNGYEKKWFNVISSKKAVEEEAYRYSTEDM